MTISLTENQTAYAELLLNKENTVYFKFHTGPSQTDYVTIEVASIELWSGAAAGDELAGAKAVCQDVTYFLAKNFGLGLGRRNTAREFQIPQGGGGYSKTHNVAYTLALSGLGLEEIPKNWRY